MIKLSFRNLWRNRRRTLITVASVFFAVFFSILTLSFSNGSWNRMIENMLRTQTGHIQVHGKGYWTDQVIDNFMTLSPDQLTKIGSFNHITNVSPRLETFAMASTPHITQNVALVGIDPVKEDQKSSLSKRLIAGNYLNKGDQGILIGKKLSEYLQVQIGDTLALIGQGYHGSGAAGLFPVRGIVNLITPEMNKSFIYMNLPSAQQFINMPDGYSGVLISIDEEKNLEVVLQEIKKSVDPNLYDVLPWKVTMEKLVKQSVSDKAFSKVILCVLYLIVGFGILGTVIMMTNERRREFGILTALGMQPWKLACTVSLELLWICLLGVFFALTVTIPIVLYFNHFPIQLTGELGSAMEAYGMEPVLPMDAGVSIFISQALLIIVITGLTILYPVRKIMTLDTCKAIHS